MTVPDTTSKPDDSQSDMWVIEPLVPSHAREAFDCGVDSLNVFLRQQASQNARRDFSRTFVIIPEAGSPTVIGYYTLAMGSLGFDELPQEKHLPHYPIPLAHLGRLAVDVRYRGRRIGEALLFQALRRVQVISEDIGAFAVEVRALDAAAGRFYVRYGFQPLAEDPQHLYLTLKAIRKFGL